MNREVELGSVLNVTIEKLSAGGDGIARLDSVVIFVPYSAPGDRLKIKVTDIRKNYLRGQILEIQTPSSSRQSPPCKYYQRCGGCNLQHLQQHEQLRQKHLIFKETMSKFLRKYPEQLTAINHSRITASPKELRYRNRIKLKCQSQQIGYYGKRSHELIPIEDCLLFEQELTSFLKTLSFVDDLTQIELSIDTKNQIQATHYNANKDNYNFSQVNAEQNLQIQKTIIDLLHNADFSHFYDLYAGAGNFSLEIAKYFPKKSITAVETSALLAQSGQMLATDRRLKNIRFYASAVELFLNKVEIQPNSFVLLDPPRDGAELSVVTNLALCKANSIIYLSCNPVSLGRDLEQFFQSQSDNKWQIVYAEVFEMFPQTDHMECMVMISKAYPKESV